MWEQGLDLAAGRGASRRRAIPWIVLLSLLPAACHGTSPNPAEGTTVPGAAPAAGSARRDDRGGSLPSRIAWLSEGASETAKRLSLSDRCDMIATVLTFRAVEAAGARPAFVEDETARRKTTFDGRTLVGATVVDGAAGEERSLFARGDACGGAIALLDPGVIAVDAGASWFAKITFHHRAPEAFAFELGIQSVDPGRTKSDPPLLTARLERAADGNWGVTTGQTATGRVKRVIDAAPRVLSLATPLPAGRAEAAFEFDTGGDIMGGSPREAGLVVVVRYDGREIRQTLASCAEASRGSALYGAARSTLDIATCGDTYRLLSEPRGVRVDREGADAGPSTVARIGLPRGLVPVRPPSSRSDARSAPP